MYEKNDEIFTPETRQDNQSLLENRRETSKKNQPHIQALKQEDLVPIAQASEDASDSSFENELDLSLEDLPTLDTKAGVFERLLTRVERLVVVLYHKIFDEVEAAMYLRLPDPENRGRETVRNYALRSKKISYYKIGRNGLTFLKADLDLAIDRFKVQSFRDL